MATKKHKRTKMKFLLALLFCANALFAIGSMDFYKGISYMKGYKNEQLNKTGETNYSKAVEYFRKAIKTYNNLKGSARTFLSDNASSYGFMGLIYQEGGHGIVKNAKKALELYKKGAKYNDQLSQYALGDLYRDGDIGVKRDINKAIHWYKVASDNGVADASLELFNIYNQGIYGISENKKLANKFLEDCINQKQIPNNNEAIMKCRGIALRLGKPI